MATTAGEPPQYFSELIDNLVVLVFIRCCGNDPFMSLYSRSRTASALHRISGCADWVDFRYHMRLDRRYREWARLRFQRCLGRNRFRGRFAARGAGRLRCFSSECVRLRIKPLASLDERNSSLHPPGFPTVTSSDRTQLAQRRRSVSSLISTEQPNRDSEGGSTCRLGYGNVSYR